MALEHEYLSVSEDRTLNSLLPRLTKSIVVDNFRWTKLCILRFSNKTNFRLARKYLVSIVIWLIDFNGMSTHVGLF